MRFGTNGDGVCRYDGTEFVYFTTKDGLGGDAIRGILEDDDGVLWFAINGGVSPYDGKTFTVLTEEDGLSNQHFQSILEDRTGKLGFGASGSVYA